jgi:hypothetical protein
VKSEEERRMEEVVMEHLLREQALPYQPGQFLPLQLLDRNHGTRESEEERRMEEVVNCDGTSPHGTGAPISALSVPASPAPRQESWNKINEDEEEWRMEWL